MGYFIRKRTKGWALVRTYYIDGNCHAHSIPPEEYYQHFFNQLMSIEEAKEQAKNLNSQAKRDEALKRKEKIKTRLLIEKSQECALLPKTLSERFAKEIESFPDPKRVKTVWGAAQKLIRDVNIPPQEWKRRAQAIYNYFERNQLSLGYAKKIIRLMNAWGEFYSAHTSTPYSHLKTPTGFAAGRIVHEYRKFRQKSKASDGLTPDLLAYAKQNLAAEHYNWLFVSLWFGLRPSEVERLRSGDDYAYFSRDPNRGIDLLNVKQTKLSNLPEEEQWKAIPILYPEQRLSVEIISNGKMLCPLPKTIKHSTLGNHHRYAGRKGFGPLMWERGHDVVEVSSWLGHKSIDRTYKDYMKWCKLKLRKVPITAGAGIMT